MAYSGATEEPATLTKQMKIGPCDQVRVNWKTGALLAELLVLGVSPLAIGGREKDAGQKVGCH
jgi:hypothetical protein